LDQKTSLLVVIPAGIAFLIELWKVTKAFKISVKRLSWKVKVSFGQSSEIEKTTENFDQQVNGYVVELFTFRLGLGLGPHLFVKVPRPGDSEMTFAVFESRKGRGIPV